MACYNTLKLSLFLCLTLSALVYSSHDDKESNRNDEADSLRSKPLILVKIWCLVLVFVGTFAAGMSPYFLKWNEGFLVLGTQFAGGVFLGTALMHFLSDSNKTFQSLTEKEYPFAFMLASVGFLITMLADCVVSYVYAKQEGSDLEVQGTLRQGHGSGHHPATVGSVGDSILLIVALCFHSFFEGIAIGVAKTKAEAWKALWTVSVHKIIAAIAMGIALLRMLPNRPFLSCMAYAFVFGISSPVGVGVGITIDSTTQGATADWLFAISIGLSCGVFIYVSINHLLSKGYTAQQAVSVDKPHYKFLAVLFGIGVISVAMFWDS
ncbi:PREDICTED: zinc transporter 11-like [Prunus mume]|uniref:Zinc transporter 11-like n=1 Tax=Prunus mume TaxID=102107 RepID=A0ABM1LY62_PRUMU|nr:PREDICTED: zinc transporter 11-like [Prunus mume]